MGITITIIMIGIKIIKRIGIKMIKMMSKDNNDNNWIKDNNNNVSNNNNDDKFDKEEEEGEEMQVIKLVSTRVLAESWFFSRLYLKKKRVDFP